MSITGAFLVLFLTFHMLMNFVLVLSADAYNAVCEFLGAHWYALAGTVVLAAGVLIHFIYAFILTFQNLRARGKIRYAVTAREEGVEWASKNMLVLGLIVVVGLLLHLYNFWYNMQLTEIMGKHVNSLGQSPQNGAWLVQNLFSQIEFVILYLVWLGGLWLHLTHGVWSMMQTVGWNSKVWMKRMKCIAKIVATILVLGFAAVVVAMFIKSLLLK